MTMNQGRDDSVPLSTDDQCRRLVYELFEEQVARTPDTIAVVYEKKSVTYARLNARANQLARYLRTQGVGPDQLVGICLERSLEMVVGLLGVLKAGGAYVPLDPSYPPERLRYMLNDAAPRVLLTQLHLEGQLQPTTIPVLALDSRWKEIAQWEQSNLQWPAQRPTPKSLAYVIYTSGSTGEPKGTMIEHQQVVDLWQGLRIAYGEPGCCRRVALNASFNFDASVQQFVQLLSGKSLFLVPQETRRDAAVMLDFMEQNLIDGIDCTPTQLRSWVASGMLGKGSHKPSVVLVGGEPIDPTLWRSLAECTDTDFHNVYGPTECTVDATSARLNGDKTSPHIGKGMEGRRIYILHPQNRRPVPVGVSGEIYIGGVGVGRGYLRRPELTAERFFANPFSAHRGARMYRTGDLGRWRADGTIEFLGRSDHQVKIRGFRIELGEIETRLMRQGQIKDAVVLVREDIPGEKRLVAYVVPNRCAEESPLTVDTLRAHLKGGLPEYMIPTAFVTLEQMPLTPNGKLDRQALPAPELAAYSSAQYDPPQGETEETLAGLWRDVLQLGRVGRDDNFFELGGHSLTVMTLMVRLRAYHSRCTVQTIYQNPTIRRMAEALSRERPRTRTPSMVEASELQEGVI